MDTQKTQLEKQPAPAAAAAMTSCRKKKNEDARFLEDLRDHIDEFIHASMDEHKTCFKKTVQKVVLANEYHLYLVNLDFFGCLICLYIPIYQYMWWVFSQMFAGMSKTSERNVDAKGVESALPLQTTVSD